jgi:hypothetical protein
MNEVLLPPVDAIPRPSSSASAIQTSFSSGPLPQSFSFQDSSPQGNSSSFLSPDFPVSLRRARSDGAGGPRLAHRQSRSEDIRPTMLGPIPNFPPSRHVDFLAQQRAPQGSQFLHPPESQSFSRGHHRRASSGSRERMVGPTWGAARSSPYPTSPSGSPARHAEPLPDTGLGNGQTSLINNIRGEVSGGYASSYSSGGSRGGTPAVARPNVTTTATADASMKRRINDAKFVCPVPGCGSTFTRHFNLKGMSIRRYSGLVAHNADARAFAFAQ